MTVISRDSGDSIKTWFGRLSAGGYAVVFLLAMELAFAAPEWTGIKQKIRNEFPDVPNLTTEELAERLQDSERIPPLLMDARTEEEYAVSHLAGARRAFNERMALELLRTLGDEGEVVVYCSVGYRSAELAQKLRDRGYSNVINLEGSIFEWANEGRAVFQHDRPVWSVHPYDKYWGQLLDVELWSTKPVDFDE